MMHWNISFNTIRLFSNGKSFKSYAIIIIVSLLLISFIFNVYMMLSIKPEFPLPLASGDMNKKLSLDGFEEVKIDVSPGFITMESECHRLIATTDISQSEAISMGIKKAMGFDPGGSSTLIVEDKVLNISPYNSDYESDVYSLPPEPRAVANAVIGWRD